MQEHVLYYNQKRKENWPDTHCGFAACLSGYMELFAPLVQDLLQNQAKTPRTLVYTTRALATRFGNMVADTIGNTSTTNYSVAYELTLFFS